MTVDAFRLKNFMAFRDTGWIELRAITLLFGRNSSGKSAIIRALRLLKQSLYNGQDNEVLRFAVEGQLDLGDFQAALHKRVDFESYADKVEGQKISFQFRGELLNDSLETIHNHINAWLEQNGFSRLDSSESQPALRQIEFGLEYGQTYDPATKTLVTQIVGIHIDCPWPMLSSILEHPEPLNFLSASRVPPLHYVKGEVSLPEAANENQFGYMEWDREWYWESDFSLEQLALQYDSQWRDIVISAVESFFPTLILPSSFTNVFYHGQNDSISHRLNTIIGELSQSIKSFLDSIEYLAPIRPAPERTYMLKRTDIERWQRMGLGAWLETLQKGAFAPPPIITVPEHQELTASPMIKWLKEFSLGEQLYVRRFADIPQSDLVAQIFIRNGSNQWINLLDVGYGASQLLPIIATCLYAKPNSLVLIEQPELHLHPSAQAELGNLFAESEKRGLRFLIETHSEHLLLRLRRRIARSALNPLLREKGLPLSDKKDNSPQLIVTSEKIRVDYVESDHKGGFSKVDTIGLNTQGEYTQRPTGFQTFFSDDFEEVMQINRDIARIKKLESENNVLEGVPHEAHSRY